MNEKIQLLGQVNCFEKIPNPNAQARHRLDSDGAREASLRKSPSPFSTEALARLFAAQGRWEEALDCCNEVMGLAEQELAGSGIMRLRCVALLATGRQKEACQQLFRRRALLNLRGKSVRVCSLVMCNGLGDWIQFCRYIPLLKTVHGAAVVTVVCPGVIAEFIRTCLPDVDRAIDQLQRSKDRPNSRERQTLPESDFEIDCDVELLELAAISEGFGIFEGQAPTVPPPRVFDIDDPADNDIEEQLGSSTAFRVGFVWRGSGGGPGGPESCRELPCEIMAQGLAGMPGISLFSLQLGPGAAERSEFSRFGIRDLLGHAKPSFRRTGRAIRHLDLVISVDTSVAHLAATIGARTWVLIPPVACWRWQCDEAVCAWYPTVRLFRMRGNCWSNRWSGVVADVREELSKLAGAKLLTAA
jgi:hypothetical protein